MTRLNAPWFATCFFGAITLLLSGAGAGAAETLRYRDYVGSLGRIDMIVLTLDEAPPGQALRGSYFYKRQLRDIPLIGEYTAAGTLRLREFGDGANPTGIFTLRAGADGPRGTPAADRNALIGDWASADGKRHYPVHLRLVAVTQRRPGEARYAVAGASDDALVERNAQAFYRAVLSGDRHTVVKYIGYPAAFYLNGRRTTAGTAAEFLAHYDRIFTPAYVSRIRRGIPHRMFANADGIMIGDGAVWLDEQGKAVVFNNAEP